MKLPHVQLFVEQRNDDAQERRFSAQRLPIGIIVENRANLIEIGDCSDQFAVAINNSADGRQLEAPMHYPPASKAEVAPNSNREVPSRVEVAEVLVLFGDHNGLSRPLDPKLRIIPANAASHSGA